ncbi:F0F1 ATP synthase subunit delta [Tepidibacillus fermentans]|uniref:ATP synthase subunit delta n=1 Tax=Tepidibacillus fermentans TaxID=1281767 RepID=A0A4R3KIL4_9BACI|nr:F0F1 ATP synthase subunit delta [Tepidibacillus fermentans]TCS83406.1 ATP synthase F1 subcomplex delta subunit [Tepidibacillus fermentans]
MINGLVAKRYAKALFEVAYNNRILEQVEADLQLIVKVFRETEGFLSFLRHPLVDKEKKKQIIDTAFGDSISSVSKKLLLRLIEGGREEYVEAIAEAYTHLSNQVRGIVDVTATTAIALTQEEKDKITQSIQTKIGKTVRLHNIVDPNIIGGMVIQIGDRLYDGSLKKKLLMVKRSLMASRA